MTEPYSAGIGGGGYFVHYDAGSGRVRTIDGRETAPAAIDRDAFIDPDDRRPVPVLPRPGHQRGVGRRARAPRCCGTGALRRWGTLQPRRGAARRRPGSPTAASSSTTRSPCRPRRTRSGSRAIVPTRRLFLPGGEAPAVGSIFRNPQLADTYRMLGSRGVDWLYDGRLAGEIVDTVQQPADRPGHRPAGAAGRSWRAPTCATTPRRTGRATRVRLPRARRLRHATVELRRHDRRRVAEHAGAAADVRGGRTGPQPCTCYLEASALAFADRAAYVGDPTYVDVPLAELLSDGFAAERACEVDLDQAADKPVAGRGARRRLHARAPRPRAAPGRSVDHEGLSTTHLTVVDRYGDVVSYTLTIEQTGGSGIVVPGRGFLLNNELTDFSLEYVAGRPQPDPARQAAAQLDVADDRDPGRRVLARARLARRLDDHHHGAAGAAQPGRPRHEPGRGGRASRAPASATPPTWSPSRPSSTCTARRCETYGHTFVPSGEPGHQRGRDRCGGGDRAAARRSAAGRRRAGAARRRARGGGAAAMTGPPMRQPGVAVLDVNETLTDLSPLADRLADVGLAGHLEPLVRRRCCGTASR